MGMKMPCFVSWLMTTRMAVKPEENRSCLIRSMDMEFHGDFGTGRGLRRPYGL